MGIRNYLIEGVSGTGKTSVAEELQRRGYHVIHGDRAFAYHGDPETGEPLEWPHKASMTDTAAWGHAHWIWPVDKVKSLAADQRNAISFFCGGSRNFHHFIDVFDEVFILDVDRETLKQRLASRSEDTFGGRPAEQQLILRLHATKQDIPERGITLDASAPIRRAVDEILFNCQAAG
jgi:adenylate kinase family enzyme